MEVVSSQRQTSALPPRQGRPRSEAKIGGESQPIRSRTVVVASDGPTGATRRRRRNPSDDTKALRAERLASLGELSAARRALEGAEIAPGTLATLAELTNPDRRPARPREVVPRIWCVCNQTSALTELDESATILSVDGAGAFDLVSRNAMMQGLLHMEGGDKLLPFIRQFYSSPSTLLWEDELGITNHIQQGEGGEQGDPLMPLVFELAQHSALVAISERLHEDEFLFASHGDLCIKSLPNRTVDCLHIMRQELWNHCKISLNHGKTRVWNRGGFFPPGCVRGSPRSSSVGRSWGCRVEGRCRVAAFPTRH